jgi:hypothetical protein
MERLQDEITYGIQSGHSSQTMLFPIAQPIEDALPGTWLGPWLVAFPDWRVDEITVIPLSDSVKTSIS